VSAKRPFLTEQPRDGEIILHCGHLEPEHGEKWHWIQVEGPAPGDKAVFERPDGSLGYSRWVCLCATCHRRQLVELPDLDSIADVAALGAFIHGDGVWRGDAPEIREAAGDA
jgi:hypothetical protein